MQHIIEKITHSLYPDECGDKTNSRIYKVHKYWARKPWYIVEKYISDYSAPGDMVMDPFCGSGLTGLEAVINGRDFVGQDLNPTALRVSSGTIEANFDAALFREDLDTIARNCKDLINSLYASDFICPRCGKHMLYKFISLGPKFEGKWTGTLFCECGHKISKHSLSEYDIQCIQQQESRTIDYWYPVTPFPKKFYKDRFSYKGILTVADMFTKRNLFALSLLLSEIKKTHPQNRAFFNLAFTNTLLHVSKLKGENVRPLSVNNYWVPDDFIEENVWFRFSERAGLIATAKSTQLKRISQKSKESITYGKWVVQKKSALDSMGVNCVDYFFTDPPYGDAIQYSELSFVWNAWMQEEYETEEEVIINPVQNKGANEFNQLLCKSLDNIYAALKPEKYFTLCFQNKNSHIWKEVIAHCKSLGFKLVDVSIYNTYGFPFNKSWANFSPKSDIYVTFQKTDAKMDECYSTEESVTGIVKEIIAYMDAHSISADNNKLYDFTIAYLIWAMYLNEREIDVSKFDIKKFTQIVQSVMDDADQTKLDV